MPYSTKTYTGNGTNDTFTVTFPYRKRTNVKVFVNGAPAAFQWLNASSIKIDPAPANGATVVIQRVTPISPSEVDFTDGANLLEADLDATIQQPLYGLQEMRDDFTSFANYVNGIVVAAGNLPAPESNASRFLVAVDGTWTQLDVDEMQAALGIVDYDPEEFQDERIPAPEGDPGVLYTSGDPNLPYTLLGLRTLQEKLSLKDLAYHNASDYDVLGYTVGTAANNLVALDGTAKLPAVDGSQLTGLERLKYGRWDWRESYDTDSGQYGAANAEILIPLNAEIYSIAGVTFDSGPSTVELPVGNWLIKARQRFRINGVAQLIIRDAAGNLIATGNGKYNEDTENEVIATCRLTVGAGTKTIKVMFVCTGSWADNRALGTKSNNSAYGPNIYGQLEIWKLPT